MLTAALIGLGLAVMAVVSTGVEDLSGSIATNVAAIDPVRSPFLTNDTDIAGND